jgi:hypothetical protein
MRNKFWKGEVKMKKLLILTLVLGIATWASAGLALLGDGTPEGTVVGDGTNAENSAAGAFLGIVGGTVNVTDLTGWSPTVTTIADVTDNASVKGLVDSLVGVSTDQVLQTNWGDAATFDLDLQDLGLITIATGGPVDVHGFDGSTGASIGSITLIPEPATMALLGLGALLLRRKK